MASKPLKHVRTDPKDLMLYSWVCFDSSIPFYIVAHQMIEEESNHFIETDVSMPIMTGYEATRAIRALEQQRRTHPQSKPLFTIAHHLQPLSDNSLARTTTSEVERGSRKVIDVYNKPALIIALTGFSSREDQEAASESGMDVFMTKPVRFKEVGKILEGFMKDREI